MNEQELRAIAELVKPHVVKLCMALELDPERDRDISGPLMKAIIEEALIAVLKRRRRHC